jgi:hypothetical protein
VPEQIEHDHTPSVVCERCEVAYTPDDMVCPICGHSPASYDPATDYCPDCRLCPNREGHQLVLSRALANLHANTHALTVALGAEWMGAEFADRVTLEIAEISARLARLREGVEQAFEDMEELPD